MIPSLTFLNVFKILGDSWEIAAKDFAILKNFSWKLYKSKQKSLDTARFENFNEKMR